jgi:uncharacterized protein (UPF0276 family)
MAADKGASLQGAPSSSDHLRWIHDAGARCDLIELPRRHAGYVQLAEIYAYLLKCAQNE